MFKKSSKNLINLVELYEKGENLIDKIPVIKKQREKKRILKKLKYFAYFVFFAFLLGAFLLGACLFKFKNFYDLGIAGKNNLNIAAEQLAYQNFSQAAKFSKAAEANFNLLNLKINELRSDFFVLKISSFEKQINNFEYLTKTAEILSRAAGESSVLAQKFVDLTDQPNYFNFSSLSQTEKIEILKLLYESGPEFNGLKANIDLAYLNLKQFDSGFLFYSFKNQLKELEDNLLQASEILEKAMPFTEMLPALAGYPEKSVFLVLFQNSNELRATGGFLGTYGILEIENGEIARFDTHDIYHMDMPVKDFINVEPPAPIKKYLNEKWYMRDANWWSDWPTSAQKIQWFYHKENKLLPPKNQINDFDGEFKGIIAITPDFVSSLLDLFGPIIIEGEKYAKDNLTDLLEYQVQHGFIEQGTSRWHRKRVIGEILKELKIRLFDSSINQWREVFNLVNEKIYKKDILVYFNDSYLQSLSREFGWAGEVKDVEGDYFMVVDSNMAAYKTDAVMAKSIDYRIEQTAGGLFAKIKINYAHGGGFDWRTTRYQNYLRVYVPFGSSLVKTEGLVSDIDIQNEFGKTYFGGFFSVEPGKIGNISFEYKLPENINDLVKSGRYELYAQKQPGNKIQELSIDLKMKNNIKSYWPVSFFATKQTDSEIVWKTDFTADKVFLLDLIN